MKENNPFYMQYLDKSNWTDLSFSVYNHLDDEGYIASMQGIYKQKYTISDFEMKSIPLSKEDIKELNNRDSILHICALQSFRYIKEEQSALPYQKNFGFKLGNSVVFVKLKI